MESCASQLPGQNETGGSATNIEIKIKTMDSQIYTLHVDKQVPVPALKEQIASVTGIVTDQQRLICRGRVLKDDKLLSAYHVEDGHTLHLVVRQPAQPSIENLAADPAPGTQSQYYQVAPGVLVETFNMSGQGERSLSDINRIVSAVLGSIGITNPGNFSEAGSFMDQGSDRIPARGETTRATQQQIQQSEISSETSRPRSAFGASSPLSFGPLSAAAIPDALSTMSLYLSHLRREFSSNDEAGESGHERSLSSSLPEPENAQAGLPTPASLAELLVATREFLNQQTGGSLGQLTRQLENQASETNPDNRSAIQSRALRTGMLFQNLGVFLLELGRAVMTLRLGQSPSEAVVNAGPGVFISPSGPNPLMVQPLPFQPGSIFNATQVGASSMTGSGLVHGFTGGLPPRRIDIQIRRGAASRQPDPDGSQQQTSTQRDFPAGNPATVTNQQTTSSADLSSFGSSGGRSVRVLPLFRSMVAAVPDLNRAPSDLRGSLSGLHHRPFLGRYQNMTPRDMTGARSGSLATDENQPSLRQAEQNPTTDRGSQSLNTVNPSEDGDRASRTIDINIYSPGGGPNDLNLSDGQVPDSVMQLLTGLFPGGEFQVESVTAERTANHEDSHVEPENTSGGSDVAQEATEIGASEDAIFFSRMLQQIMPFITDVSHSDQNATISNPGVAASSSTQPQESSGSGSSRRNGGTLDEPDAKRHKMG